MHGPLLASVRWRMPLAALLVMLLLLASVPTAALAAISWQDPSVTNANADGAANTLSIDRPAGVEGGDFLLAQITFEKGSEINVAEINAAAPGWTLVRRDNRGTDLGQAIFYRVADAEPASYTWQFRKGTSLEAVRASGGITRYTGVNTVHPHGPIVDANGGVGDSSTLTAPQVDALADSMLVAFFGIKKKTTLTPTASQVMTELYFQQHSNGSGPAIRARQELRTADGATGPRTAAAGDSEKWVAQQVALRPNTVPDYTAPADQEADEGEEKAFDLGSFVDPDAHAEWDVTVDWGDGTDPDEFTVSEDGPLGDLEHTYADNNAMPDNDPYMVTVTVDDGIDEGTGTFEVLVHNVAPDVEAPDDQTAEEGLAADLELGSFSDPGVNDDPWAVEVDWGDGTEPDAFTTDEQGDLGSLYHTYSNFGDYTVRVTVEDKDGDSGYAEFDVEVSAAVVSNPDEIRFESATNSMTTPAKSKGDASKTLTIGAPADVAEGDFLLAQITFEKGSDAGSNTQITPSGWTLERRTNRGSDLGQAIFYRVATDNEPASYTFPFNQAVKGAGGIMHYTGVDAASPIVASGGGAGDSRTLTAPSVNAADDSVLVSLFGFKKKDTTLSVPDGMTGIYNYQNPQDVTIRAADELRGTANGTGNRVSTPSPNNSDKWVGQNVVLRPAD